MLLCPPKTHGSLNRNGTPNESVSTHCRSIQYQDTPDAAKRPTTTRAVLTAPVYHGKPIQFFDKLNHEFHYEYILKGHRLIHNDIIITLFKIFKISLSSPLLTLTIHLACDQRRSV